MILPRDIEEKIYRKWLSSKREAEEKRQRDFHEFQSVVSLKDSEKCSPGPTVRPVMKSSILGLVLAVLTSSNYAGAAELPAGYNCMYLRTKVSEYGPVVLISMAKSRGFTDKEIRTVRRKCRV